MMTGEELRGISQALWTTSRLERMKQQGLTAEEVTRMDIDGAAAKIKVDSLRVSANSAMGRVLEAGGVIADLFHFLYSIDPKDEEAAEAIAESVIALCEHRINELNNPRKYED